MRTSRPALDFAYVAVGRVALAGEGRRRALLRPPGRDRLVLRRLLDRRPRRHAHGRSGIPATSTASCRCAGDAHRPLESGAARDASVAFNRIAPRDAAGKPQPALGVLRRRSQGGGPAAARRVRRQRRREGRHDLRRRALRFDPVVADVQGPEGRRLPVSPQQVAAIKKAMAGPSDSKGHQVYPKFLYDTGIASGGPGIPGLLMPNAGSPVTPDCPAFEHGRRCRSFGSSSRTRSRRSPTPRAGRISATFSGRGGKLLFYHGVSDPWFSAIDTVGYYERLGADQRRRRCRPRAGAGCSSRRGWATAAAAAQTLDRFDLLTPLVEWVEKGTAPDAVIATGRSVPGRSRPLCAYPQYAHYKGTGNPEDAASFECRP